MSYMGQLGELSADEAKSMTQAIAVLQLCAEGAFASETKSLWELLKPMLRDEVDEPEFPAVRQPWSRPLPPLRPRGPSMVVVKSAPKLRPEASEFRDLVGAEVALVVARGVQAGRFAPSAHTLLARSICFFATSLKASPRQSSQPYSWDRQAPQRAF
jgi:hypothetical protein